MVSFPCGENLLLLGEAVEDWIGTVVQRLERLVFNQVTRVQLPVVLQDNWLRD